MIDVLLVLLVIFIMAVPMMRKAIDLQLARSDAAAADERRQPDQIVLQVLPNGAYKINSEAVTKDNLAEAAQGDLRAASGQDHLREG